MRESVIYHVVTSNLTPAGTIFACWTAIDTAGQRGPVYDDLDDEGIDKLRTAGYVVEQIDPRTIDKSGKY